MLKVIDRQTIIHMHRVDGMSQRAIHRETGYSRSVIKKIVDEYERAVSASGNQDSLEEVMLLKPEYDSSRRHRRRLTDEMAGMIDDCLKKNRTKDAMGMHKQRMLKCDIYNYLRDKGFEISYSTVCNYIRSVQKPKPSSEAFVRQHYSPGEGVEFDWGEVKLFINGDKVRFFMAVFTFQYSNCRKAYLFRHQNTLAFLESHRNFYRDVKGVPSEMIYDNMRVAIKEFVGTEKLPTEALLRMSCFYGFRYRFCNIRAGWEKGHVERSVEYVRRKAFCLKDHFPSIEAAQDYLTDFCHKMDGVAGSLATINKKETVEADLSALGRLPGNIGCFEMQEFKVDKWSTFCFNNSHYSVPDRFVGQRVKVKVYSEKVVAFSGSEKIASHERSYKSGDWKIDLMHYLNTMQNKPGSLHSSEALYQAPEEIKSLFSKHFKNNPKEFVSLLVYASDNGFSYKDVIKAYNTVKSTGVKQITKDHITAVMGNKTVTVTITMPAKDCQAEEIEKNASSSLEGITGVMAALGEKTDNTCYNNKN